MRRKNRIWGVWILGLISLSFIAIFIAISSGSVDLSKKEIMILLLKRLKGELLLGPQATIIFDIRIPRIIIGFLVGGALSLAGVIFQSMFRNPLVEPYTLGVSGGAALMISFTLISGYTPCLGLPLAGFFGAILAIVFVYTIGSKWRGLRMTGFLLTGVMFSFVSASLIMFILSIGKAEEVHGIIFWIMGSLGENEPTLLKVVSATIPIVAILSFFRAWDLNALALGEEEAIHLGVNLERAKKTLFILASLMTGLAVSISGIIGFVGLVVPHFIRMFIGTDHRIVMPASFLLGGIFLILCDTVARTIISPIELPVGVLTGIIGGTIFLYFLSRKTNKL